MHLNKSVINATEKSASMYLRRIVGALCLTLGALYYQGAQATPFSVYLDDLTWTETRDALRVGATTIIVPVGGTEQSGPHMALGKHNVRVHVLAGQIAGKLGNALVAPVVAYVPEGQISPPSGHMRFAGSISIPDDAFIAVLLGAGRSLKQHGFLDIVFIGDHGGYQSLLKEVAQRLNREWAISKTRAHYIPAYYRAADEDFAQALRARGLSIGQIGTHAGLADTSLMMAVDPSRVRVEQLGNSPSSEPSSGVSGDPKGSSAVLGRIGVDVIVDKSVQSIRQAITQRP
ncbi:MAG: creatininase family protein [Polaromonas sp.]|uniref:creatininase family protein n=1 Tax=Polaromonas sp. TaxID=1869339 RepID=UPI00248A841F|nr:creatininase family protein [Polaromonas sp.]MDI1235904.1 creatininase family protein [Polaromonas sp.]